jgi:hypothetical protein
VIQLSPQIQNTESPPPELLRKTGPEKAEGAEKKDDPGVFARLLAGLLRNIRNPQKPGEAEGKNVEALKGLGLPGIAGKHGGNSGAEAPSEEVPELRPERGSSPGKKQGTKRAPAQDGIPGIEKAPRPAPEREKARAGQDEIGGDSSGAYEKAAADPAAGNRLKSASPRTPGDSDVPAPPEGAAGTEGLPEAGDPAFAEGLPLAGAVPEALNYPPEDGAGEQPEPEAEKAGPAGKTRGDRLYAPPEAAAGTGAFSPSKTEGRRSGGDAGPEGRQDDASPRTRTRTRRKERFSPEIRDLRTAAQADRAVSGAGAPPQAGAAEAAFENRPGPIPETEIPVELRTAGARTPAEIGAEREARPAETFHEMLSRELHQNLNGDIVRHASILLRDGGEGLIRLSLKPESLGNVKIRLEMAENKIAGHIIVESDDALRAFEQEIRSLERAFLDSGFDGANLEMSLAGDGGQYGSRGGEAAAPFFEESLRGLRAAAYDTAGEGPEMGIGVPGSPYGGDQGRINMLV